ncbi:MAG TPA: hypothetical protein VHY84_05655 [Bryobacteraceae bacterium]|jgi:hypothetical protein|nr:hypothetical protein [Bryobacteraceae bacterium]
MSSILRIAASRANGAKSRGPVTPEDKAKSAANSIHSTGPITPEGQARSSQNAARHGILSASVVLPAESAPAFTAILTDLQEELRPETAIEHRLVEIMAVADWRRSRLWCLEMAQYVHGIHKQELARDPLADQENAEIPSMHAALAFKSLSDDSRALELLNRYEGRFSREYLRTLIYYKCSAPNNAGKTGGFPKEANPTSDNYGVRRSITAGKTTSCPIFDSNALIFYYRFRIRFSEQS